jgi:hypothetical protein
MSVGVRRQHQVMEDAIRAIMGAGTPPTMSIGSTYASIVFPQGYTIPDETTLTNKYNELIALEADRGFMHVSGDMVVTSNLEVGDSNLFVDTTTGKIFQNGKEIYNQLRWEIDLTSQSNTTFYPIEFTHPGLEGTPDLPDMHPIHFKIFGESLTGADPFNENTLVGYAKGGGWSDHGPMYDVHVERHVGSETRFQGLYEGNSGYMNGIVIYMRGGYRYSALTDATEVVTHTSAYTNGSTTFALKNSSGTDVSGTSALITQLVNIAGSTEREQRWMSGKIYVSGDVYATGNVTGYSDKRAKEDIKKIENALEKIEQLNGYTYTMNNKRYTGLIAQEVLPVLPEAVTGSEDTNYALAYGNMMGLIVEAIKELKKK